MLYIWPYFLFFSIPIIYPWLLNLVIPQRFLSERLHRSAVKARLPSLWVSTLSLAMMLAIVHYNTVVHPFTLADNRHYMFYVFRILLYHWSVRYLAVPIYFICAWATITALGGPDVRKPLDSAARVSVRDGFQVTHPLNRKRAPIVRGNIVPFALVWLLATTLSLITAPLVEPRYLILPWLFWRLHAMSPNPRPAPRKESEQIAAIRWFCRHDHRLWLETLWFLIINVGTGFMFLYRGFAWPQEPGKLQRFMW